MANFNQAQVQTRKDLYILPTFNLVMGKGIYIKSEEQKRKISETLKGRKITKEHRENISKSTRGESKPKGFGIGRKMSEETKDKIRISLMGRRNPNNRSTIEAKYIFCKYHNIQKIPKDCVLHHINGDKTDNRIENLKMMKDKAHRKMHAIKQKLGKR